MAQVVESLTSKHEALHSDPSMDKNKKLKISVFERIAYSRYLKLKYIVS
jgi:hypothetical protein